MDRRADGFASLLRQLAGKTILLPNGRTISWLELQAIFLFVCCLVCSCCSLGSYLWGCVRLDQRQSASINAPRPTRTPWPPPGVADAGTVPATVTPTRAPTSTHTPRPTGARLLATPTQWTPPSTPSTAASPQAPTGPPAPTDTPPPMPPPPTLTPTPTPTPTPTETPTASPTPTHTAQPTLTPTDTPTPTPLPSDVRITHVEYNPLADPLVDEYVMIENRGFGSQDMTGWTLSDDDWNTYFFLPGFVLPGGESVLVWTTSGTDTDEHLYWGRSDPVWGNQNDTAYLRDNRAAVVDSVSW